MRCRAIVSFATKRGIVPMGTILNIPDALLTKLAGKVEELPEPATAEIIHTPSAQSRPADTCQAKKVGGRICSAPLKEGNNRFSSCSDPACQVPVKPHGFVPRNKAQVAPLKANLALGEPGGDHLTIYPIP